MHLYFMSFLHIDMTLVVEIFPHASVARTSATVIFTMLNRVNSVATR